MAASTANDKTPEEALAHWMIVLTWPMWLLGALYHVYPILAWVFAIWGMARRLGYTAEEPREIRPVPLGVWVWLAGTTMMVMALVVGHLGNGYGVAEMVKSLLGWAKGWALFALLPFAGSSLRIRPYVLIRSVNILSVHTLAITPVLMAGALVGLPSVLYMSPLYYLGGASHPFFQVGTHWVDPGSPDIRFRFYAPWGPAAAFVAQMALVFALHDRDWRYRAAGVVSAIVVCYLAKSRLSAVAIPLILVVMPLVSQIYKPAVVGVAGLASVGGAFLFAAVQSLISQGVDTFRNARADSSRVRETLQRIALHRWENEAAVFGHGMVERGPHLVEFMPIGSHHTWNGLLFIKGAVGALGLAVPLGWSFVEMLIKAQRDPIARVALGVVIVLFINSFAENIEILVYLIWPALLLLGIAFNRRRVGIWSQTLGTPR